MLEKTILFEANTLQEAYEKASLEYDCSITNLKSEVIQMPNNGFLGIFKKNAIIKVIEIIADEPINLENEIVNKAVITPTKVEKVQEEKNYDKVLEDIKIKVNDLFSKICYDINEIEVKMYDDKTVLVHFTGNDSALLIGKEGYRYKAMSYILFNWIHDEYGLMLRLEIAEFLQNQEEHMKIYVDSIIDDIKAQEYYKTKILDGILIHIALTILREELPNKYIAVKQNVNKEKYILINEYKK